MIDYFTRLKADIISQFSTVNFNVACTFDLWTGCNDIAYVCVTAHYIDYNWTSNKRIVAYHHMESPHTGLQICQSR